MKVSRKTEGAAVYFVISEAAAKYHDAIRHLYYEEENNDFAKSFPSDAPHVDKCYYNFERHIEQIILQMAGVQSVPWDKALLAYLKKIGVEDIDWWLCGSAALAVRGIDIMPHDIDVITDEAGAYRIGEILQDHLFEPIVDTQGWICRVFGKAFLYAVIDIAGGVDESVDKPEPSGFGPVAASHLETVKWRGYELRVPPLELQLRQSERRGLTDRTAKIASKTGDIRLAFSILLSAGLAAEKAGKSKVKEADIQSAIESETRVETLKEIAEIKKQIEKLKKNRSKGVFKLF